MLSVLSGWLIEFRLYLALTSCIPEISSFFSHYFVILQILDKIRYKILAYRRKDLRLSKLD